MNNEVFFVMKNCITYCVVMILMANQQKHPFTTQVHQVYMGDEVKMSEIEAACGSKT